MDMMCPTIRPKRHPLSIQTVTGVQVAHLDPGCGHADTARELYASIIYIIHTCGLHHMDPFCPLGRTSTTRQPHDNVVDDIFYVSRRSELNFFVYTKRQTATNKTMCRNVFNLNQRRNQTPLWIRGQVDARRTRNPLTSTQTPSDKREAGNRTHGTKGRTTPESIFHCISFAFSVESVANLLLV